MTEQEAQKLATDSQNMVHNLYKKIGTDRVFVVTDITKNRETNSNTDWVVLVSFKDEKLNELNTTLVENITYFISAYERA